MDETSVSADLECPDFHVSGFRTHCEIVDGDPDPTVYPLDGPWLPGIQMQCPIASSIYDRSVTSLSDEKNAAVTGESDGFETPTLSWIMVLCCELESVWQPSAFLERGHIIAIRR